MKRIFFILPILFCLTACWDYVEPSSENYVLGMGIDYADGKYLVAIETVKITGEAASLSSSEGVVTQGIGETLYAAVKNATTTAGKSLYWGHMEIIFLSEDIAKNRLYTVLDLISRTPDIYSNVDLSVAKDCSAADILSAKIPQGAMASVHITNIFENEAATHRFRCCSLWQLKQNTPHALIPAIYLEDTPLVSGCAVFQNGNLQGYLNGDEVFLFSLIEDGAAGGFLPDITIDNTILSTEILDVKAKQDKIDIIVAISNSNKPFDAENPEKRKNLETKITELISEQVDSLEAKPFVNLLSYDKYDIRVSVKSSGLTKR